MTNQGETATSSNSTSTSASSTNCTTTAKILKFAPFASTAEASFWTKLAELKLNVLRLDEGPVELLSTFAPPQARTFQQQSAQQQQQPRMRWDFRSVSLTSSSLDSTEKESDESILKSFVAKNEFITCQGTITLLNTVEAIKKLDKKQWMDDVVRPKLIQFIENDQPDKLNTYHCFAYLDLKKHNVVYWFMFGALYPSTSPFGYTYMKSLRDISGHTNQCESLARAVLQMRLSPRASSNDDNSNQSNKDNEHEDQDYSCPPFFMAVNLFSDSSSSASGESSSSAVDPSFLSSSAVKCLSLSIPNYLSLSPEEQQTVVFAFVDPSGIPTVPGWPLRNLLSYLYHHKDTFHHLTTTTSTDRTIPILCYRPGIMRRLTPELVKRIQEEGEDDIIRTTAASHEDHSLFIQVSLPSELASGTTRGEEDGEKATQLSSWNVLGWELNARQKPGPRIVNLSSVFDSTKLSEQSVDLNLKLMKWRLLPNLQTDLLAHRTKCLLLGAGTLGCNVARTLLGWGVRNITFVDNGRVSYSNPVRQSLFVNADCANGGKYKSEAAAESLKQIFPGVQSKGIVLSIPMPGHTMGITTEQGLATANETVSKLDALIQEHDVIFLLTDTRESRWLPTLLCATYDKMLINAALGLDSWLVMRHGRGHEDFVKEEEHQPKEDAVNTAKPSRPNPSTALGCYFCNDVVAPSDSMKERTMDQQCTVTRPGLAPIASAMAVELMVTLLHTPNKHWTHPNDSDASSGSNELGSIPHQIRGFLSSYTFMTPTTPRFDCCTACSLSVVQQYRQHKFDFIKQVTEDTTGGIFLEELTGLAALKRSAEEKNNNNDGTSWDIDNDDDDDDW